MTRVIEFKDKVVVITGAGGVLCGYLAKEFAKAGAKVALLDLNEAAAQVFVDEIAAAGGVAKAYKSNVLSKENLRRSPPASPSRFWSCRYINQWCRRQ